MADTKINLGAPVASIDIKPVTPPAQPVSAAPASTTPNIFGQTEVKKSGPKMIESIVAGSGAARMKPILGNAPTLQKTLEQEKEYRLKQKLRLVQVLFVFIFLAAAGTAFYFYSELAPEFNLFGQNTTNHLADVNKNLHSLQTQVNKYRYLAAQLDLNRFSYVSDQYLDKTSRLASADTSPAEKQQLAPQVTELQGQLPVLLANIRNNLTKDIVIPTVRSEAEPQTTPNQDLQKAQADLKAALMVDRTAIQKASTGTENLQDLKLIDNTIKLVGNKVLLQALQSASVDGFQNDLSEYGTGFDPAKRKTLQDFMGTILSSTKNDVATIGSLKNSRINWSKVIQQIETVTAGTDKNFGRGLFDSLGGILYTGYEFDTNSNKIVLSGITKTSDAGNFSLISRLIDDLESSLYFQNVDMRAFAKSGSVDTGFTANFKIDLNLESGNFSPKNKPISLIQPSLANRVGVKRIK